MKKTSFHQYSHPHRGSLLPGREQPDLFTQLVGHMHYSDGFYCNQITASISFHAVWEGSGIVEVDGQRYIMAGGDVFVFFPACHIIHYDHPGTRWHYHWISLAGRQALPALAACGLTPDSPMKKNTATGKIQRHVEELEKAFAERSHTPLYPIRWAWDLIGMIEGPPGDAGPVTRGLAEAARSLISSQYMETATVADLAEKLKVDRTTLFRHFRKEFGVSPKAYMEDMKLKKAQELLKHSDLRIKEVAPACGFTDVNYFCRLFRSRFSSSPEQWRRLMTG